MELFALVMCLISTAIAYTMHQQTPRTQGLPSISFETLRQQQAANTQTAPFSQISRFGYNDPYSVLWLHGLLPPHSFYPWQHQRPQLPDNQQYQTIMNKLLQQGVGETMPDPAGTPPVHQQHPYPGLFSMQYGGGPGGPPARLGAMSSEEITGSRAGAAHTFSSLYPGLLGMGPGMGRQPQNPALQGDFTIEDDSPVAGGKPAGQEISKGPIESPQGVGLSQIMPGLEGNPTGQGETVAFPNINLPNLAFNPQNQSKFPPDVTPVNAPRLTHDTGAGFPFALDNTIPFSVQRENGITMEMTQVNNANAIDSPMIQVHPQNHNNYFQEP